MDLMIASISQHHGLVLVTNNTRHFERIKSFAIEHWASAAHKHSCPGSHVACFAQRPSRGRWPLMPCLTSTERMSFVPYLKGRTILRPALPLVIHPRGRNIHIPSLLVVERVTAHRKPPEVRIWRLSSQSRVGTVPPSTSTPQWPACWARR